MNKSLKVKIAGLCAEIRTEDFQAFSFLRSKFIDFLSTQKKKDLTIEIRGKKPSSSDQALPRLVFKEGKFYLLSGKKPEISLGHIDLEKRNCSISGFEDRDKLLHSALLCFALFIESSGGIILHASAAYKNGQGILFPGPANAGKSTILKQLNEFSALADEWVAVKKDGSSFRMGSIPCQNVLNKTKKLQHIFFPKKGKQVAFKRLKQGEAAKRLLKNCLFSTMHPEIVGKVLAGVAELAREIPCFELEFPLKVRLDREIHKLIESGKKRLNRRRKILPEDFDLSRLHEPLILTWNCNLLCRHCHPYLPQDRTLSFNAVKKHLDSLTKNGTLFLHLTGGEPLVHQDFWKISSLAQKKKFALILHTNGTLITPETGEKLKSLNFLHVFVTVLGGNKQTHDHLTGVEGSFERTISGLKILKENDLDVILSTTQLKENQEEIPDMRALAEKLGVKFRIIPFQTPNKKEYEEFNQCYQKNFQES